MRGFLLSLLLLPLLFVGVAPPLSSQTVVGELVDEGSRPVGAAFVLLRDSSGVVVARALTGADGRFSLGAPASGRYTLRAERIGYASTTSPPLLLRAGDALPYRMTVTGVPVTLEGIVVGGRRRCAAPAAGEAATATLWEEARKALDASEWTAAQQALYLSVTHHRRETGPDGERVVWAEEQAGTGRVGHLFVSVPVADLTRSGYRRPLGGAVAYYAPDASVLLSNLFLSTHCFRAVRGEGPTRGMVGLAFEPLGGRRITDVRGTLWLDVATRELRYLEYTYTRLPRLEDRKGVGGRVEFLRLPGGVWIVSRWNIRMPIVRVGLGAALLGFTDGGGEVRAVARPDGRRLYTAVAPAVVVAVVDGVSGAPLRGASVSISGTAYRDTTDAAGRAVFPAIPDGSYLVTFAHAALDSAGYLAPVAHLEVRAGDTVRVRFAAPPPGAELDGACSPGASGGEVYGTVRGPAGEPAPGALVRLWWERSGAGPAGYAEVEAGRGGRYRLCGVPAGVPVSARADLPGHRGEPAALAPVPVGVPVSRDLSVASVPEAPARVLFRVLDAASGASLPGARVRVRGTPLRGVAGPGGILFEAVPPGTYRVEVELPGRAPSVRWVVVPGGAPLAVDLRVP